MADVSGSGSVRSGCNGLVGEGVRDADARDLEYCKEHGLHGEQSLATL